MESESQKEDFRISHVKDHLHASRLNLVRTDVTHSQELFSAINSPGVLSTLTMEVHTLEEFRKYLVFLKTRWEVRQDFTFTIKGKHQTNPIMGQISVYNINYVHFRGELGIWLGREFWHQGYALEAMQCLVKHVFENLHLNRLEAHVFTKNKASIRLFEKCGFVCEGKNQEYVKKQMDYYDVFSYALLRRDWREES